MNRYFLGGIIFFFIWPGFLFSTSIQVEQSGTAAVQSQVLTAASELLGTPYMSGGAGENGVDCSGLIWYVFDKAARINLPRMVVDLFDTGEPVSGYLQPADLLFFDTLGEGTASHVGISLGDNRFIHAASAGSKTGVIISSLEEKYYKSRFLQAERILQPAFPEIAIEIDQEKATQVIDNLLIPGVPLYFEIKSKLDHTNFIVFKAVKAGEEIIVKRFRNHLDSQSIKTWFIPDNGTWTILFADDINETLAVIKLAGNTGG